MKNSLKNDQNIKPQGKKERKINCKIVLCNIFLRKSSSLIFCVALGSKLTFFSSASSLTALDSNKEVKIWVRRKE